MFMPKGRPQKPKPNPMKTLNTPSCLKGFKDILPTEEIYWKFLEERVARLAEEYGFQRIETPILEETTLFLHAIGRETDIVRKELFSFPLNDGTSVSLRPEGTAGVARAYINHGMFNLPQPVKVWYMGPMFRHDRPQAGRYREFHQFGFEIIGSDHPILDAELIGLSVNLIKPFEIQVRVLVNSIGCRVCRPAYLQELAGAIKAKKRVLCADCRERLKKNVLRVLDCKEPKCQEVYQGVPKMMDRLCEECKKHFTRVLEYCDDMGIPYTLEPRLVRGLDYYTKTVFELVPVSASPAKPEEGEGESAPGRQDTIAGGGRYDNLIEMLGGRQTPALGVAWGMERLLSLLKPKIDAMSFPSYQSHTLVFLAQLGEKARKKMLRLREDLKISGVRIADAFSKEGLRPQLELAAKLKAAYTLILGEKEVIDGTIIIRDMNEGVQEIVPFERARETLAVKLENKK
jgi:histidyl-tRNA synthetase